MAIPFERTHSFLLMLVEKGLDIDVRGAMGLTNTFAKRRNVTTHQVVRDVVARLRDSGGALIDWRLDWVPHQKITSALEVQAARAIIESALGKSVNELETHIYKVAAATAKRRAEYYDRETVLEILRTTDQYGSHLFRMPREFRADREVVLKAVRKKGDQLRCASLALRANREVVLEAMSNMGGTHCLACVSEELRDDRAIVMAAVGLNGSALEFASDKLKGDREVVRTAVRHFSGIPLRFASQQLRADIEVVLEAMQGNPNSLQFASDDIRARLAQQQPAMTLDAAHP